ncbi:ribosomal-processing cysteine protease Prp [[Clostridium] colinum]|uniref:ribosomal-processing cysteine protease Prp n=1 Tax=[Clostridium] colinum TaxID=36835 RepID=UPI0020258EB4|nr:ribosomal-processing cysteine protease Prp [[Clostridium] colinum]
MIQAIFFKNNENIIGFEVKNHGKDIVCSAVSILTLNTVNSIEVFTDAIYSIDYDTNGGFLKCIIDKNSLCEKTILLLSSLELGLKGIEAEYPKDICLKYKEV